MKVVFHFDKPLPVKTYGGIERIVFWHMVELVKQGHQVSLIGHPDSKVEDFGIELIPYSGEGYAWEKLVPSDADVAHLSFNYQLTNGLPTLSTVHGNAQLGEKLHHNSVFVSKRHAEIHGGAVFVHNALDFAEYPFNENKTLNWDRFLFLAKASWRVKNLRQCIRACRRTRKKLEIIGGRAIIPRPGVTSHGLVGGERKLEIINNCDALLFPVRWEEPFGIAMIEAMALGLPVIGSKYGSLPEIITKESGILCSNFEELVQTISNPPDHLTPVSIRKYVETHFSITEHTCSYLELYEKIIAGEDLHTQKLSLLGDKRAESLLPF